MNDRLKRMKVDVAAVKSSASATTNDFRLLDFKGLEYWAPQTVGTFMIRILPFEVKLEGNPDGRQVGSYWYRRLVLAHYNVGESQQVLLCPSMKGDFCPVCAEIRKLSREDYEGNKQVIQALRPSRQMAYLVFVVDPKTGKSDRKPKVFLWGVGKFSNALDSEIKQTDVRNLDFASADNGKLIKFRIVEDTFAGKKFLKTDRIDFVENKDFAVLKDSDLESLISIDDMLLIPTAEEMKQAMEGKKVQVSPKEDVKEGEESNSDKVSTEPDMTISNDDEEDW